MTETVPDKNLLMEVSDLRQKLKKAQTRHYALLGAITAQCMQTDRMLQALSDDRKEKIWEQARLLCEIATETECVICLEMIDPALTDVAPELQEKLLKVRSLQEIPGDYLDLIAPLVTESLDKVKQEYDFLAEERRLMAPHELKKKFISGLISGAVTTAVKQILGTDDAGISVEAVDKDSFEQRTKSYDL